MPAMPVPGNEAVLYCLICDMNLNGPAQYADHVIGKKHRKNQKKRKEVLAEAKKAQAAEAEAGPHSAPSQARVRIRLAASFA